MIQTKLNSVSVSRSFILSVRVKHAKALISQADYYPKEELQEHQPEAIQYAKERVERLTRDQAAVICRDSNPVTTVYELVEFLNGKRT